MADKKPHLIQVKVVSISDSVENQIIDLEEGAFTPEELTIKCFTITDAINNAMKELAEAGGYPTEIPPSKPKPKTKK